MRGYYLSNHVFAKGTSENLSKYLMSAWAGRMLCTPMYSQEQFPCQLRNLHVATAGRVPQEIGNLSALEELVLRGNGSLYGESSRTRVNHHYVNQ